MRRLRFSNEKPKHNKYLIWNLIVTLLVVIISLFSLLLDLQYETILLFFAWMGNAVLIWGIYLFKKIKGTNINQYTLFYLSYYFFSYGQIFLYSLGFEYQKFNLIRIFPSEDIIEYCLFFCVGTCFFLMGALIAIRKDTVLDKHIYAKSYKDDLILKNSVKFVSWGMFFISAPLYLQNLILNMSKSIKYGYGAIYEITSSNPLSNLVDSLGILFIPSLFMIIVIYQKNKLIKWSATLLLLITSIGIFIIGTRSSAMAIIISLVFIWNAEIKKFTKKDKIILFFLLVSIILLLPVIQEFRKTQLKTLDNFFINLRTMYIEKNLLVDFIGELGGSMQPWLLVKNLIPEVYSYKLGQSYIASFMTIIPSILLGGFSFAKYAHLSGWLKNAAKMTYGPGFSILAESYYNFGWFGVPFLVIIGWLYYKFLSNNMLKGSIREYKNMFSAIALFVFITSARGSLYLLIRTEVYSILLPILLIKLINNNKKKNSHRR